MTKEMPQSIVSWRVETITDQANLWIDELMPGVSYPDRMALMEKLTEDGEFHFLNRDEMLEIVAQDYYCEGKLEKEVGC